MFPLEISKLLESSTFWFFWLFFHFFEQVLNFFVSNTEKRRTHKEDEIEPSVFAKERTIKKHLEFRLQNLSWFFSNRKAFFTKKKKRTSINDNDVVFSNTSFFAKSSILPPIAFQDKACPSWVCFIQNVFALFDPSRKDKTFLFCKNVFASFFRNWKFFIFCMLLSEKTKHTKRSTQKTFSKIFCFLFNRKY